MNWFTIGLLVFLAALMLATVAVYNLWGFTGLLGAFVLLIALVFLAKKVAGRVFRLMLTAPFRMMGQVLRDAAVTVHQITPAAAPQRDLDDELFDDYDEDEDDFEGEQEAEQYRHQMQAQRREIEQADARRRWFYLDLTISPGPPTGDFTHWKPDELVVVDPESRPDEIFDGNAGDQPGEIFDLEVWDPDEKEFYVEDGDKYDGPQRLRLHVGVEPNCDRLALRYYLEQFGQIELPSR